MPLVTLTPILGAMVRRMSGKEAHSNRAPSVGAQDMAVIEMLEARLKARQEPPAAVPGQTRRDRWR